MWKNKTGFTFIEILVVVAILSIVWMYSFGNFSARLSNQELDGTLSDFYDSLRQESKNLWHSTLDYTFDFFEGKNYYILYKNIGHSNISYQFDEISESTGSISFSWASFSSLDLFFYENKKLIGNYSSSGWSSVEFPLSHENTEILFSFSGSSVGQMQRLVYQEGENESIVLESISTSSWGKIPSFRLTESYGGSMYYSSSGQVLSPPLFLTFLSKSWQKTLVLNFWKWK